MLLEAIADLLQGLPRRLRAVSLEDGGIHPVALLARRVIVHRGEDRDIRLQLFELFAHDVTGALLAGFVLVGLQQANDDGLRAGLHQIPGCLADFVFTQRDDHLPLHVGTLGDAARARDGHQRLVVAVGVQVNAVLQGIAQVALQRTAHRMDLLEAAVADQADGEAFAHENAVEHCRPGVNTSHQLRIDVIHGPLPVGEGVFGRVVDGKGFVAGIALRLADHEAAIGAHEECVGHRAASIDAHHLYGGLRLHVASCHWCSHGGRSHEPSMARRVPSLTGTGEQPRTRWKSTGCPHFLATPLVAGGCCHCPDSRHPARQVSGNRTPSGQ
ncbi:hypothetical protein D9M72_351560 [compost metagenome]